MTEIDTPSTTIPLYLVIDTSASMRASAKVICETIREVFDQLLQDPVLRDMVQISIIQFDARSRVVLPLVSVDEVSEIPDIRFGGPTYFGPALSLLRERLRADIARLKSLGTRVYRPIVMFITDGASMDRDFESESIALHQDRGSGPPLIFAFGVGDADPSQLRIIANAPNGAFLIKRNSDLAASFREISTFAGGVLSSLHSSLVTGQARAPFAPPSQNYLVLPPDPALE